MFAASARRAASIIALCPCDVRVFSKRDFDRVCDDFPQLKTFLQSEADKKYSKFAKKAKKKDETGKTKKDNSWKKHSLKNLVKAGGKAISNTVRNISPPKNKLTTTQSLVAKIRSSPKLSPKGSAKRPLPKSSPLAAGSNNHKTSSQMDVLTSLYTQSARIENMLQTVVKTMSSMDRRIHALELACQNGTRGDEQKTVQQLHPVIPTGKNPRNPPDGLPKTVRPVLSPEHRETLNKHVHMAQTNGTVLHLMRRSSYSPNRPFGKNSPTVSRRESEPNYIKQGFDEGEKKR